MNGSYPPVHPGEILLEEFMKPLGLSSIAVARSVGVPRTRIERLVKEQTGVSADTALRLGQFLNTTPQFWMNLQNQYDLALAVETLEDLSSIQPIQPIAS